MKEGKFRAGISKEGYGYLLDYVCECMQEDNRSRKVMMERAGHTMNLVI
jgi:hypothetical protein